MSYINASFKSPVDLEELLSVLFAAFPGSRYVVGEEAAPARGSPTQTIGAACAEEELAACYRNALQREEAMRRSLGPSKSLVVRTPTGSDVPGWFGRGGLLLSSIDAGKKAINPIRYLIEKTKGLERFELCLGTPAGQAIPSYILASFRSPIDVDGWLAVLFGAFPGSETLLEDRFAPWIERAQQLLEEAKQAGKSLEGPLHVLRDLERCKREEQPSKQISVHVSPGNEVLGSIGPGGLLWSTQGKKVSDLAVMRLVDFVKETTELTSLEFAIEPP